MNNATNKHLNKHMDKRHNPNNIQSAFCDDVLGALDATAIAEKIKNRDISTEEVETAALARAAKINPKINAIVAPLLDAKQIVKSSIPKDAKGVFYGIPSFIKDCEDVQGLPTQYGTRAFQAQAAKCHSPFVKQYLSLGMSILGKTTLPEWGLSSITESLATGNTVNPWNTDYSPGGSSGGAAALVAAGVTPIAHGSDGGGSIRTPASCCGLIGLKPSRGRLIPPEGKFPIHLACQGVLTRSVRDTVHFYLGAERYQSSPYLPPIGQVHPDDHQKLTIGVFLDNANNEISDSECVKATLHAAHVCEKLNHNIEFIPSPYSKKIFYDLVLYYGFLACFINESMRLKPSSQWSSSKLENYTRGLEKMFLRKCLKFPFSLRRLRHYQYQYAKIFDRFDLILCPTNGTVPPKIGFMGPENNADAVISRVKQHSAFTVFQNIAGTPAISLPLGMSQLGLPIGVHFAAAFGQERQLLSLAYQLEDAQPRRCISQITQA
ncbi:amidase [uncultured Shewanella sp.]|uniref:amidase n=1 Tax=uncultured Shewanella sp. TaxID=173975 RepID=UPI002608400E|nr:amidase [uncultured Shewanella sp.]